MLRENSFSNSGFRLREGRAMCKDSVVEENIQHRGAGKSVTVVEQKSWGVGGVN